MGSHEAPSPIAHRPSPIAHREQTLSKPIADIDHGQYSECMFGFLRKSSRLVALLLLVLQFGIVAHRIEHYLEPEHMECGEDACEAFTPITDPPALPIVITAPTQVVFAVRFWTASDAIVARPSDQLGFRAQAPPV